MDNYFSKTCNKTSRKFFEDFDLLPREIKMMLCHQGRMPTFEDLKAAWDLAAEEFSIDKLKTNLHVYEEERKAEKKRLADLERERARRERSQKRWDNKRRPIYEMRKIIPDAKNARLIQRVTDEQAVKMMADRAENKDVKFAGPMYVKKFIGYEDELKKNNPELDVKYYEPEIPNHLSKQMHNA